MADTTNSNLKKRPPVVVVVGHVDHGKTTLLDYIRRSSVAAREAGGITQAISAYEITHNDSKITFIDTPGHEAFGAMRRRGAAIADLAILIVAADEGIKPQTLEAISIIKESGIPFVVAMNKIDKDGVNIEKLKADLAGAEVYLEGYGGDVSFQPISAKTGEGVGELLDLLLLAADVEGLTYDPAMPASGFVLESRLSKQRGLEVVVVVKNGVLRFGDAIAAGTVAGRIKILEDFVGVASRELLPCAPALIVGFSSMPVVGETFSCAGAEVVAAPVVLPAQTIAPVVAANSDKRGFYDVILKAADAGSLEALFHIITSLSLPDRRTVRVLFQGVGDVNDGDVQFAISTGAVIVGFKSRVPKSAATLAQHNSVMILSSDIVYELVQAIENAVAAGATAGVIGEMEVLAVFNQEKLQRQLVGGAIVSGIFKNKGSVEIRRGTGVVGRGSVVSLRQQKKEAVTVTAGNEAGVVIDSPFLIEVGDRLILL